MQEPALSHADLCHAFEAALAQLPVQALERFAERKKLLQGGYRPGNPALLRALVASAMRPRLLTYEPDLAVLMRTHAPASRLLSMLSREVLRERAAQLMAFFGKAAFLLGLLMDPREDVRATVPERMASTAAELPEAAAARDLLAQAFAPVVALGEAAPSGQARRETIAELRKQLDEADKKARRERRAAEEQRAAEAREIKSRLATMQFNIDERQKRIDQLEARLARAGEELERRARALASARRIEALKPWLEPAQAAERALAKAETSDLLERARRALTQQALFDRASARHAALLARRRAVQMARQEVAEALAAAINRAPELVQVHAELEAECAALDQTLALPVPESALGAELQRRIDALTSQTRDDTFALLALAERLALLPKLEIAALKARCRQRANAPAAAGPVEDKDAAREPSEGSAIERRNPELAAALQGSAGLLLFLDGHNVLNGLSRYKQRRGTAVTHEDARRALERDVARLLRERPLVQAHLVWDGAVQSDASVSENLTVHYSGGEGEHRADRYILDQLSFFREAAGDLPRVLVTDDNDFAGEARRLGAAVCRLHDFEAFMPFWAGA